MYEKPACMFFKQASSSRKHTIIDRVEMTNGTVADSPETQSERTTFNIETNSSLKMGKGPKLLRLKT